jgi:nucleoside-diphosphate-sugar epimerase
MREFLHVDDMAAASVHVLQLPPEVYRAHTQPMLSYVNVGTGVDCTIRQLAETVARVVGFSGRLVWDTTKPDGAPRKLLDVSRLAALGWRAQIGPQPDHRRKRPPDGCAAAPAGGGHGDPGHLGPAHAPRPGRF